MTDRSKPAAAAAAAAAAVSTVHQTTDSMDDADRHCIIA